MSNLKRSQKLCPKCGGKNFIRQFKCNFCSYEFPKKDKSRSQNASIEQFFFKMPMIKNDFKNDKNEIINLNEDEEELSVKSKSRRRKEKSGEKKEKIFDKNEIIENNKIRLNKLFILLEKQGIPNNLFIEKNDNIGNIEKYIQINYDDSTKKRINYISFPTSSIFPYQSFDICPVNGINSYCISILFREENNINILTNIIIYFNIDNANQKIKKYIKMNQKTKQKNQLNYYIIKI